ncbi:RAD50 protein [Rhizoctonia solani AG-1 IA]|uniref:DNA repair protein RAD50 n=1 Tax=Thanatephorus cucumeris (strain AG1-IA) TaxID=983506 RepID=L8X4K0_THACA|nr:RAD50 protein [Rhizoctonia solani AG-1 IA]
MCSIGARAKNDSPVGILNSTSKICPKSRQSDDMMPLSSGSVLGCFFNAVCTPMSTRRYYVSNSQRDDPKKDYEVKHYRASLNKLAIRGIRSFDDKSVSVIEFYSPVTVIVGHNGSGKTVREQPPNTRGGAFVHDPKMANEKEVKAQVKLRFFAANRTRMLAVRNLAVTVTKAKMTMKTLEGILATSDGAKDNNKRGVISTKCAELDAEIPHLLGVSKSVLENVIFCHQEDSYWPLAEASVLKKKFDDIFEATRYTKALDNIKSLRKERVADLKADKERLHSLGLEKAHADRLKSKIDELTNQVAEKTQESEETEAGLDAQVAANTKFYDSATRFQQIFLKVEHLEERRSQVILNMEELKKTVTLVDDPTDVLKSKVDNYDAHCANQRTKRATKATELLQEEDSLAEARQDHQEAVNMCGEMRGQAKVRQTNTNCNILNAKRDTEINNIGTKYGIRPNTSANGSLDRDSVVEFNARLGEMARAQALELERLQNEYEVKSNEYQSKKTELQTEENALKHEKETLKTQMQRNRSQISTAETSLDTLRLLETELKLAASAVLDAYDRLSAAKAAAQESSFESQIAERTNALGIKTDERERLQQKLADLQSQAETRAKLGLKRADFSRKQAEIDTIIGIHNERFKAILGTDAEADTMERDVDQALIIKDKEIARLEADASAASREMHSVESALTSYREQIRKKEAELKALEQRIKSGLADSEHSTVGPAIKAAQAELDNWLEREIGQHEGAGHFYSKILKDGKTHKKCVICNRKMDEDQLIEFEKTVGGHIQKRDTKYLEECKQSREDWAAEVGRLQALLPVEETRDKLRDEELPAMQIRAEELDSKTAKATAEAQEVCDTETAVKAVKSIQKELQSLKSQAGFITRTQQEVKSLQREIQQHERDLAATGSTQTAEEVQAEIDQCGAHIKTLDRERTSLMAERDRQYQTLRTLENEYSSRQLEESELKNRMKDQDSITKEIETLTKDNLEASARLKAIDGKLAGAQQPLQRLEQEQKRFQSEHNSTISLVSRKVQELNSAIDRLENISAPIERSKFLDVSKNRYDRALRQCETRVSEAAISIAELEQSVQELREELAEIDREIHEAGATLAKFRDNLSLRKMKQDIENIQTEIAQHDLEQAGAAKAQFDERYQIEKDKENKLRSKQARLAGELGILKSQLKSSKQELASQFQGINEKYTKQLVQVKMADMANNDLEKYAKALDNAIMKYHALKMEEVNDTMRHLWNKTYQGTGGWPTASYNYRVVMMKDQVEMDMRGRCSAGQKMLASIIIRLALSDSFGQNCGILALDEPTNALDTENIDALASSLVDIINERRHLSNFQLIIITHDESFLRKLGQAEVMEYYWRVSRDSRQKSVIERQRFN